MADYTQPPYQLARVRYFNGQFLKDADFIDEQKVNIDRRRRHQRLLHVSGIAEGLGVTLAGDGKSVTVAPGTAVDDLGRLILLAAPAVVPIPAGAAGVLSLEISFREMETDLADPKSVVSANTRFTQSPLLAVNPARTAGTVLLAELPVTVSTGTFQAPVTTNCVYSGVHLPGPAGSADLTLRARADGQGAVLSGGLKVVGLLDAGSATVGGALSANSATVTTNLGFGAGTRQMLNLSNTTSYGIGVQTNTMYERSAGNFAWYKGGAHNDAELNAGGGTALMTLTATGLNVTGNLTAGSATVTNNLGFGVGTRQMLNLQATNVGIGVQSNALYHRSSYGFAWFQNGSHFDAQYSAGGGGTTLMTLDSNNLTVNTFITAANVNAEPILSTQPATRFSLSAINTFLHTGESLTFTVPAGPSRRYRIVMRQMLINNLVANAHFSLIQNFGPPVGLDWHAGGTPYITISPGNWASVFTEGIILLPPGTYTFYVVVNLLSNLASAQVANATSDGRLYCNTYAIPI